jgi:hypothetical protein
MANLNEATVLHVGKFYRCICGTVQAELFISGYLQTSLSLGHLPTRSRIVPVSAFHHVAMASWRQSRYSTAELEHKRWPEGGNSQV